MNTPERLSRKDRRRWRISPRIFALFSVLMCLAAILAYRIYFADDDSSRSPETAPMAQVTELSDICDSLIARTYASFGLEDSLGSILSAATIRDGGGAYRLFRKGWPEELPFIIFAQRLTDSVSGKNIRCDCLESTKEGWLDCTLRAGNSVGARITLEANSATNFAGKEVAIAFENFSSLTPDDIVSLLKSGMVLSYMARVETYPSSRVRELIAKKGIAAILVLPASRSGWKSLIEITRLGKPGKKKSAPKEVNPAIIDEALERHPGAKLIYFDFSAGTDEDLMAEVAKRAKAKRIAYLLTPNQPSKAFNVVVSTGIQLFTAEICTSLSGKTLSQMKIELLKSLMSSGLAEKVIVCPNASELTLEELWKFKIYFEKIGVKFRPLMRLIEPFEGPPRSGS
jgi:hypothetical protein